MNIDEEVNRFLRSTWEKLVTNEVNETSSSDEFIPLTREKLEEAMSLIPPRIVVRFSSSISDDKIFHGEMIDKILNCSRWEKGFLVPRKHRESLLEEGNFEER